MGKEDCHEQNAMYKGLMPRVYTSYSEYLLYTDLKCDLIFFSSEIMNEVIRTKRKSPQTDWRVLVVDKLAMRMVSTCLKMHEISAEGITSK